MKNEANALDALIAGFKDGGCGYASNYPGSASQDIFFGLGGERISANEKTAFEMAYGASLAGVRSLVTMKNVGLNTCADPYLHSIITGVQGGLVIVIVDDTQVTGSQEREDSRHFIDFFGGLWLEPSTVDMAYDMAYESFSLSERFDIPVTIRLTSQFFDAKGTFAKKEKQKGTKKLAASPKKFIAYPTYWHQQWNNLIKKRKQIAAYIEDMHKNVPFEATNDNAAIIVGACNAELQEGPYSHYAVLTVNHYPLPLGLIGKFALNRNRLVILEQGDPYALEKITLAQAKDKLPFTLESSTGRCPDRPQQWKTWSHLEKLFGALGSIDPSFVMSDVGQYTVESKHVIDACLCLGSAVGVTLGLALANVAYPFCVVGDGAFLHSSMSALQEAQARSAKFGAIIIDNGGSAATGGQPLIADIHAADQNLPVYHIDYHQATEEDIKSILSEMQSQDRLALLYVKFGGVAS